jgi:hypothetical protein
VDGNSGQVGLAELTEALDGLATTLWRLGQQNDWKAVRSSSAQRDRDEMTLRHTGWDDVPHLGTVLQGAMLTLATSAHDHLSGLARLLQPPQRSIAAGTTLRGLLESAGRAWYLADSHVEPSERARRVLNDTMHSLHEMVRLRKAAGEPHEFPQAELAEVIAAARSVGQSVRSGDGRRPPFVDPPRPSSTALSNDLLGTRDGLAFRVASGVAHGSIISLLRVAGPEAELGLALSRPDGALTLSPGLVRAEYGEAVVAFYNMASRVAAYFGWTTTRWRTQALDQVAVWLPE